VGIGLRYLASIVRFLRGLVGRKRTDTTRGDGVVRGIVLVTLLTVALEVGFLGLNGVDVNPLHIGAAQAQAAAGDSPPDKSIDCDNDKDGGTDFGESAECFANRATNWISDNADLIFFSLAGLALGVVLITALPVALGGAAGATEVFIVLFGGADMIGFLVAGEFTPGSRARDARLSDIALPAALAGHVPSVGEVVRSCRRVRDGIGCRRVALAARAYGLSLRRTASASGALAVTVQRLRNAGTDPGRQTGTAKVLALRALDALTAQHTAALAYAHELRRAHINLRLSVAQTRRALAALRDLKGIPKALIGQLERNFELSEAELKQVVRRGLARTIGRPRRLDLIKELERPVPFAGVLRESYESLRIGEVARLVNELVYEKRVSTPDGLGLMNDLLVAQRACTPQQRRGPIGQFAADVRAHVHSPFAQFLQEAAVPLLGNHPYPKNVAPTAIFTPTQITQRASPGHPLQANFIDDSNDNADGGEVGCFEWNFGDPASGADNISFERDPTHNYAQPGNYTVTLTAIDDDGFASNTTTGHVTANP
jgi:hypothetical protein